MKCPAEGCGIDLVVTKVKKVFGSLGDIDVYELLVPEPVNIAVCPKCEHVIIVATKEEKLVQTLNKDIILP